MARSLKNVYDYVEFLKGAMKTEERKNAFRKEFAKLEEWKPLQERVYKDDDSDDEGNIDYSVIIAANTLRKMGFNDNAVNKVVKHEDYEEVIKMTKDEIKSWLSAN